MIFFSNNCALYMYMKHLYIYHMNIFIQYSYLLTQYKRAAREYALSIYINRKFASETHSVWANRVSTSMNRTTTGYQLTADIHSSVSIRLDGWMVNHRLCVSVCVVCMHVCVFISNEHSDGVERSVWMRVTDSFWRQRFCPCGAVSRECSDNVMVYTFHSTPLTHREE